MSDMAQRPCLKAQIQYAAEVLSHFIPMTDANVQINLHIAASRAVGGFSVTSFAAVLSISVATPCACQYLKFGISN